MGVSFAAQFADSTELIDLHEMPIAVTGSWVKDGHRFSITKEDFDDIIKNFDNRGNGQVVVDYEHASERPEVARGGPVPAAGWIHNLEVRAADEGTGHVLWAGIEWQKDARKMLKDKKYKFFSPAIDWGAVDKQSGKGKGATVTSGALTNHPFLEELPEIELTAVQLSEGKSLADGKQIIVPVVDNAKIKVKIDSKHDEKDKEEMGEISLDQKRSAISDAVRTTYGGSFDADLGKYPWVKEIFEAYAVVETDGKLYKLDYKMDKKGNVTLGKPKQVTIEYVAASDARRRGMTEGNMSTKAMNDMQFSAAVLAAVALAESNADCKILCAEVRTLLTSETLDKKALSEKVVKLLDDMDQYGIRGDRGMQDKLRKEATSRASKVDDPSDGDDTEELREQLAAALAENAELRDKRLKKDPDGGEGTVNMGDKIPRFTIRKIGAADKVGNVGHHALIGKGGKLAGYISHNDLIAHAKEVGAQVGKSEGTMRATEKDFEEVIQEATGRPLQLSEVTKLVEVGITAGDAEKKQKARKQLMSEALVDGKLDHRKARRLFATNKVDAETYADFEDAVEDVNKFIEEGRFLPKQRGTLVALCLADPESFKLFANDQPRQRRTETLGLTEGEGMTAQAEVNAKTEKYMTEHKDEKITYGQALSRVLASDNSLKERYDKETKRQLM